ncbi:phage tail-collar fiber domain-containing protein [Iodobacter ciconiae]|uniref:Uncharacterized protein n=1 Tax=Iodobacter ciconiae TaxID=2496266 RepID=A0A3S8ZPY2_9NEIS|nr:phage tail protein [Iodobacter ciconiae]AZN35528.1 hypothetical protein EJO50_02905 [Iodobacter ciconiae]
MSQKYFAILTQYGAAQIAEATAQKKTIRIETMAVGDGAGKDTVPSAAQTRLVKENYRSALNSLKSEAGKNTLIAELIIKEITGGWWIREMGLYDDKGGLIAVANCPPSYKPKLAEGSGKVQTLRMVFVVSNTAAVTISASQDIGIASIELLEETMKKHIAGDDPHSKDYYNKKITDKTNADLKKELAATAVKEGSRGRDEAKKYADDHKVALTGNQSVAGNKTFSGDMVVKKITAKEDVVSENSFIALRNNATYAPSVTLSNKAITRAVSDALADGNSVQVAAYQAYAADAEASALRKVGSLEFRVDKEGLTRAMWLVNHRDGSWGAVVLGKGSCTFPVPISAPDPAQTANDSFKVSSKWVNDKLKPYRKGVQPLPANVNLNDYREDGVWYQPSNANAISGQNYPAPFAGVLEVFTAGSQICIHRYTLYHDGRVFTRAAYNNVWNANWALIITDRQGTAYDAARLGGKVASEYTIKSEADERYPILTDLGGKGLALKGCVNSETKGQVSNALGHDWIQGVFNNNTQPAALDNKTAWLTSMSTQYSKGYAVISKIGTYRSGFAYGASMVFQMTGEKNLPLGLWEMRQDGAFISQSIKSRDPAASIADKARDYDGVSSLIRWNKYGNGHVIIDASAGTSPAGTSISNIDAQVGWSPGYPTLMGWNGVNSFGLRVDSARYAEGMADGSFGVPVGVPLPWPHNTPPAGWIFLQGQSINPNEAPILARLYGAKLPDMRAMYISGWDAGRGIDPGRNVLSYQAANVGQHEHITNIGYRTFRPRGANDWPLVGIVAQENNTTSGGPSGRTRPDNIAFNYIVRWG